MKELDMNNLINTIKNIKHVNVRTNTWKTIAGAGTSGLALVIGIVVLVFCFKHKNCLIAKAWSRKREGQARPDTEVEVVPLRNIEKEKEKNNEDTKGENIEQTYDIYPKL